MPHQRSIWWPASKTSRRRLLVAAGVLAIFTVAVTESVGVAALCAFVFLFFLLGLEH